MRSDVQQGPPSESPSGSGGGFGGGGSTLPPDSSGSEPGGAGPGGSGNPGAGPGGPETSPVYDDQNVPPNVPPNTPKPSLADSVAAALAALSLDADSGSVPKTVSVPVSVNSPYRTLIILGIVGLVIFYFILRRKHHVE